MHKAPKTTERWTTRRQVGPFLLNAASASWWPWPLTLLNPQRALLGPVVMIGVPVLLNRTLGASVEAPAFAGWAAVPLLFAVRTVVGGGLGEELGWRGFLLPRFGPLVASLLIAPVWFVFHLPVLLAGPATAQRPPLLFLAWIVPLSVLLSWLYLRTGRSVLIVTLFHGSVDTVGSLLFVLFTGAAYLQLWLLVVALTAVWAAAVVWLDPMLWPVPT